MNTLELIAMAVAGVGTVAGIALAIYSVLPPTALNLAAEHGRYSGLGSANRIQ
jgi:flagellar motor component MotA